MPGRRAALGHPHLFLGRAPGAMWGQHVGPRPGGQQHPCGCSQGVESDGQDGGALFPSQKELSGACWCCSKVNE